MSRSSAGDRIPRALALAGVLALAALLSLPAGAQEPGAQAPDTAAGEEAPEPLTPVQADRDEEIRARLQSIFDRIDSLQDVEVTVEAGIVWLRGRAFSMEARDRAAELARQIPDVVWVEDELRVVTDLIQRLEPTFERIREQLFTFLAYLPLLVVALLTVVAGVVVGDLLAGWDGPHLRAFENPFVRNLVRQGIRFALALAGILVALEILDAAALVGAVLGAAGVLGLALGFAFKEIVENHLAGILLSLRRPFDPDDLVEVAGNEGRVVRLTARETILMTVSGNHVRIPNAQIVKGTLVNYSRNPRRRFDFPVAVGTGDDLLRAVAAGERALERMEGVMDDPAPEGHVQEIGDSWVTIRFFGWVDQRSYEFLRVRADAVRRVKLALEEAGITLPSPEYAIALRREGPPREEPREPPVEEEVPAAEPDVSVDRTLEEQIAEDRLTSKEEDLLSEPEG